MAHKILSVLLIDGTFRVTYHQDVASLRASVDEAARAICHTGSVISFAVEDDALINLNYEVARHSFDVIARRANGIQRKVCVAANTRAIAASLVKKAGFVEICSVNMIG